MLTNTMVEITAMTSAPHRCGKTSPIIPKPVNMNCTCVVTDVPSVDRNQPSHKLWFGADANDPMTSPAAPSKAQRRPVFSQCNTPSPATTKAPAVDGTIAGQWA